MDSHAYDRIGRRAMAEVFVWLLAMTLVLAGASWVWFASFAILNLLVAGASAWRSAVLESP